MDPNTARRSAVIAASTVFAVAVPLLFICGSVRSIITSKSLYDYDWWRYDIAGRTGLDRRQLDDIGAQFRTFFTDGRERLDLTADYDGTRQAILHDREELHMVDVKTLVRRVFVTEWITGVIAVLYVGGGFFSMGARFWHMLQKALKYSAIGSAATVAVIMAAALINFDAAFTLFHQLGFSNDLWQLDPYRDYLLLLFPESFFMDATMAIAVMSALEFAVALLGVRWFERVYRRLRSAPASGAESQGSDRATGV